MEKRIGFIGCYSHDIILMLARVLACTEKKVLIRDCNKRHILRDSIPIPDAICREEAEVEYDGVFFTERSATETTEWYDIELIDYGLEVNAGEKSECTDWVVVTDMVLHHIRRLEKIDFPRENVRACVVRDSYEDICKGEPEIRRFLNTVPGTKEFFLPPDIRDVRNRCVCETAYEYNVNRASPETQRMIYSIAELFCVNLTGKEIRRRIKRRERRRYC